jgi:TPR repeat protein
MGILQENGGEQPPDYIEARIWYGRAAAKGVAEAEFRLGKLVSEGLGGSENQEAAFQHYMKAAQAGLALAQYNVGAMLASGRGTRRDYVEGLAWLIVATRDAAVDPEGERQLRGHLARRPADITAAETRAKTLVDELAARAAKQADAPKPAR